MTNNCHKSQPSLYWATIAYAVDDWRTFDRAILEQIKCSDSKMTVDLLEGVARRYSVIRGSASNKRECLCDILNKEAEKWTIRAAGSSFHLKERAERCIEIMCLAKSKGCFSSDTNQISAVTKFMWFLRPKGWTMYDNFAATGLDVQGKDTVERMREFYGQLQIAGFEEGVRKMQCVINKRVKCNPSSEYQCLPATRIVDRFLMFRGTSAVSFEASIKSCRQVDRKELEPMAEELEEEFGQWARGLQKKGK